MRYKWRQIRRDRGCPTCSNKRVRPPVRPNRRDKARPLSESWEQTHTQRTATCLRRVARTGASPIGANVRAAPRTKGASPNGRALRRPWSIGTQGRRKARPLRFRVPHLSSPIFVCSRLWGRALSPHGSSDTIERVLCRPDRPHYR